MENNKTDNRYADAVKAIKTAILQSQYEAAKEVNRVQLVVYYAVGKYLSVNTRKGVWGTGAIDAISKQLRRELPGLRGFSPNSLWNMRKFYESWEILDDKSTIATVELEKANSTITIVELEPAQKEIDIVHSIHTPPHTEDFPVEDFFKVPFTHHLRIIESVTNVDERYYYIHRTASEYLTVERLKRLIKEEAYKHQGTLPNNFSQSLPDNAVLARKAVMMFKDEYLLDYINVSRSADHLFAHIG
jgi:hypothetical protein